MLPRFMTFIEIGWLLEAVESAEASLAKKLAGLTAADGLGPGHDRHLTHVVPQAVRKAAFLTGYAALEQSLDDPCDRIRSRLDRSSHQMTSSIEVFVVIKST